MYSVVVRSSNGVEEEKAVVTKKKVIGIRLEFRERFSDARADNTGGPLTDIDDYLFNFSLTFDECTPQFPRDVFLANTNEDGTLEFRERFSDARADNTGGPLTDIDDYLFNFSLTFDECTSQFPRDAFLANTNEDGTLHLCTGGPWILVAVP
ncbi:hypothetical protein V1478_000016 [Vespula squamosa]|uniref:Uncharacterized protein n=1 Tax=Vespula squamosa TaxID=30214 RepID=A0ABD2C977_VESSQ